MEQQLTKEKLSEYHMNMAEEERNLSRMMKTVKAMEREKLLSQRMQTQEKQQQMLQDFLDKQAIVRNQYIRQHEVVSASADKHKRLRDAQREEQLRTEHELKVALGTTLESAKLVHPQQDQKLRLENEKKRTKLREQITGKQQYSPFKPSTSVDLDSLNYDSYSRNTKFLH